MTRSKKRQLKQSLKASCIALYLLANVAGLAVLSHDWSAQDDVTAQLCTAHITLMTNVMPDIHC